MATPVPLPPLLPSSVGGLHHSGLIWIKTVSRLLFHFLKNQTLTAPKVIKDIIID